MKKYFIAGLILFVGCSLSIASFWLVNHQLEIQKTKEFEWASQERYRAFEQQLNEDIKALELHKYLDTFQINQAKDFDKYAQILLIQYSSINSLHWLSASAIEDTNTGLKNALLKIKQADNNLKSIPYEEVFDKDFQSLLIQARDDGHPIIGSHFTVGKEHNNEYGLIVLSPVYSNYPPISTVQHRQKSLTGFVVGILMFDSLFKESMGHLEPRGIDIFLLDQSAAKNNKVKYYYSSRISHGAIDWDDKSLIDRLDNHLKIQMDLDIANQQWLFIAKALPQYRSALEFDEIAILVLVGGFLFTLLLAVYFYSLSHAKNAIQTVKQQLQTVLQNSPDHIIILNTQNQIQYINKDIFELDYMNSIGKNFFDCLPKTYHQRYKKGLNKVFSEETNDLFHYSLADFSHWEVRIFPIQIEGEIKSAMIINSNISQQHNLQMQATENARLASIGVLATGIAHEINNPNNSIYYNANFLHDAWDDILPILKEYQADNGDFSLAGMPFSEVKAEVSKASQNIIEHTSRIKKIVANLKSFARKSIDCYDQDVQLLDVIDDALLIINNEIRKYCDHLIIDLPSSLPTIKGNSQKLEQVFINIVLNALHALESKDKEIHITARYDEVNKCNIISIKDQGIGIEKANLEKITQPFYTTKTNNEGTGLGLSISSSIIKEHNGKLKIDSQAKQGTTVSIILSVNYK